MIDPNADIAINKRIVLLNRLYVKRFTKMLKSKL